MNRKQLLSAVAAACLIGPASAGCITNDSWRGPDKVGHFAVGVAVGSAGTLIFKSPRNAFLAGLAVGALKEAYDTRSGGTCTLQDFAMTALGAAAGAYGTAWVITPRFIGYARTF